MQKGGGAIAPVAPPLDPPLIHTHTHTQMPILWSDALAVPGVKVTMEGIMNGIVPIEVAVTQSSTCPASSIKVIKATSKERVIWTV